MATNVLLTIDTELMWTPHVPRCGWREAFGRSYLPAGVGVPYQLRELEQHKLKAVFFVDPMPAVHFGIDPVKAMVEPILAAGQEVQLHLHPQWASLVDGQPTGSFELNDYSEDEQQVLIERAFELLIAAGAPTPLAFRAGSYAANDATLRAVASLGLQYDSSHNGSQHPWPSSISLAPDLIAPVAHAGLIELPVTLIGDLHRHRHLQICAVSLAEMHAALDHAARRDHPVVTIVSHSFELATRNGQRANRAHLRRFDGLCAYLDAHRSSMPTRHFADLPPPALDHHARPMANTYLRTFVRQAQQIWSNFYEERA